MKRIAVFSLATPDRIAHARVLFAGLARHNPEWERHIFVVDRADGPAGFSDGLAIQRSIEELPIPDLSTRFGRYTLFEATNSIKPFGFRRLFADGFDTVFYLDADIWVLSQLREAEEALSQHSLVLTPHLLEPLPHDELEPTEEAVRRAGSYNGGFLAMRETSETHAFLDWWERRLTYDCLERSCHDQSWLNFVPCFVAETLILRHPGYNLAYWNLPNRGLSWPKGRVPRCADGLPVRFFHFSGFDWRKPEILSKWDTRFRARPMPSALSTLIDGYLAALRSEGVAHWSQVGSQLARSESSAIPEGPPRLQLSEDYAIPDFLLDWLRQQPAFQAAIQSGMQGEDLEEALRDFLLLPDKTYPWLPIFLGRTFDALPRLRETFRCESGFFVQDLATWFESVGRSAVGFGPILPSRGWWTEEQAWETHLRRALERWLRRRRGLLRRSTRSSLARGLRHRLLERGREERQSRLFVDEKPRIHVYGHFLQTHGFAEATRGTVRALQRLGYLYRAIHVPDSSGAPELPCPLPLSLPGSDAPIAIIHGRCRELRTILDLHPEIGRFSRLRIAFWTGAREEEPQVLHQAASLVEEVWCPSEHDAATLCRLTGKTVRVAPLNVDLEAIESRADRSISVHLGLEGKCVFLVLADFFTDPKRKNPLLALRAYLSAFPAPSPDRLLLLKVRNVKRDPDYFGELLAEASSRSDIFLLQSVLPRPKMFGLLLASTALISLHANASFGLSIAEMLSLGKPVVATAYGGNMEFCSPKNARLIGYRSIAVAEGLDPVGEPPPRVEPLWEEAVPHLQAIYHDWLEGQFREVHPDAGINERSIAMFAQNLRLVEQLLQTAPARFPNRSAP